MKPAMESFTDCRPVFIGSPPDKPAAAKAAKQHRSVKLRPMTPYERRIVHIALRDDERVETASEGEGSARHVVVVPL